MDVLGHIASNMVEANASQMQRGLMLTARLSHNDNRVLAIQHGAGPERICPMQTNIDTTRQMPGCVHSWLTCIHDLGSSVHQAHKVLERERRQGELQGLGESRTLPAIVLGRVGKVG